MDEPLKNSFGAMVAQTTLQHHLKNLSERRLSA
jgi:hypothetical protein